MRSNINCFRALLAALFLTVDINVNALFIIADFNDLFPDTSGFLIFFTLPSSSTDKMLLHPGHLNCRIWKTKPLAHTAVHLKGKILLPC